MEVKIIIFSSNLFTQFYEDTNITKIVRPVLAVIGIKGLKVLSNTFLSVTGQSRRKQYL